MRQIFLTGMSLIGKEKNPDFLYRAQGVGTHYMPYFYGMARDEGDPPGYCVGHLQMRTQTVALPPAETVGEREADGIFPHDTRRIGADHLKPQRRIAEITVVTHRSHEVTRGDGIGELRREHESVAIKPHSPRKVTVLAIAVAWGRTR